MLGVASLAGLAGCAPLAPPRHAPPKTPVCRTATAWSTAYARERALGALPAGHVRVLSYRIGAHPAIGRPCGSLILTKHLTLLRGPGALQVVEVRDFYTHGHLVASHRSVLSHALRASGAYIGRLTLPIPGNAPAGRYEVVSRLYARWGLGPSLLIARASAHFSVARAP